MDYDELKKLSGPKEPTDEELKDIEEHLDDYSE